VISPSQTSTYTGQHNIETQETNIYAPSLIRNRDPSNRAAADYASDRAVFKYIESQYLSYLARDLLNEVIYGPHVEKFGDP
jgi:hypothetical protein